VISKSLIVGMGLTGVGLGLAGSFATPAEAGPYLCSASTTIGSCSQTIVQTAQTDWTGTNVDFIMNLFNSAKYGPMTGLTLTVTGTINFGAGSTITNTTTSPETYTYSETSSFSFQNSISALQTAINALSPPPIASESQTTTSLGVGGIYTLSTAAGTAFTSTLTGPVFAFEAANGTSVSGGTTNLYADTKTGETVFGGGGNAGLSVTTFATLTLSYVYNYGVAAPEPLSAAVLGSGLLGLGMLRRRKKRV
jgi:hypothetical protein